MDKILYLDFDGVICNSIKRIVQMYNDEFGTNIQWTDIETYNFAELNISHDALQGYFSKPEYFNYKLEFMDNAEEVISRLLDEGWTIRIVSLGTDDNVRNKGKWVGEHKHLSRTEFIGLPMHCPKSHVDMSNGIFIEDVIKNLDVSNAAVKIIFGDEYEWNKTDKYHRCYNWYEVYDYINQLVGSNNETEI